jgi:hypothetical protein
VVLVEKDLLCVEEKGIKGIEPLPRAKAMQE